MKPKMATLALGIFLAAGAVQAVEWSTNLVIFQGGSYDGWDRQTMPAAASLGGALASLSSGVDQTFAWTIAQGALATVTILAEDPKEAITNGGTLRVSVPAGWQCRFDAGTTPSFGGNAVSKVNTASVSYSGGGRTLQIAVTSDFVAGDTLTVGGLKLLDLALCRAGSQKLELDFDGDGVRDGYDLYVLQVGVTWSGGAYDGWDRQATAEYASLEPPAKGTVILVR